MAYNKEYYEKHKEQIKKSRDKYRNDPQNREKINKQQREKYQNLSDEQKQQRAEKIRQRRCKNLEKSRMQYRIDLKKRQLKLYLDKYENLENKMFMLKMVDTWTSEDFKYSDKLFEQMHELKEKIDTKKREILELKKEKENCNE